MPAKLQSNWPQTASRVGEAKRKGLVRAAEEMRDELLSELHAVKTGRVYRRAGRLHQASAPGESPATDLGTLEGSIGIEMVDENSVSVFTTDPKAELLEFGTTRMSPRPMWTPIGERMAARATEILAEEISEAV